MPVGATFSNVPADVFLQFDFAHIIANNAILLLTNLQMTIQRGLQDASSRALGLATPETECAYTQKTDSS